MKPSEEIRAQREFLLANKHVYRLPNQSGEGCLLVRVTQEPFRREAIGLEGTKYVTKAMRELGYCDSNAYLWNDFDKPPVIQVIDVLEYAEKLAKIEEGE